MQLSKYIKGNPLRSKALLIDLRNQSGKKHIIKQAIPFPIPAIHTLNSNKIESLRESLFNCISQNSIDKESIIVFCSEGGPQSKLVWELAREQHDIFIYKGGMRGLYKWVKKMTRRLLHPIVLAGKTGSGKTDLLSTLKQRGLQTIDLEGLANHSGSVFGSLNRSEQPSQFQFELSLANLLDQLNHEKPVFLESEQINIGQVSIPLDLWNTINSGIHIYIYVDDANRLKRLIDTYANHDDDTLVKGIEVLSSKLGAEVPTLIERIQRKDYKPVAIRLMKYFDNTGGYQAKEAHLTINGNDLNTAANEIVTYLKEKAPN